MPELQSTDVRRYLHGLGFSESKSSSGHLVFGQDSTGTRFVLPDAKDVELPTLRALEKVLVGRGVVSSQDFRVWLETESPALAEARYARARTWFETNFTSSAYATFENLLTFTLDSRPFLAQSIASSVFLPVAQLDAPQRAQRMVVGELEVLALAFAAIEDLGRIVIAVQRPAPEFPASLMSVSPTRARKVFHRLSSQSPRRWRRIFPFATPRSYGLKGEDAAAFDRYYDASGAAGIELFKFVAEFIRRNELVYTRYAYGSTFASALQAVAGVTGIDYLVGVQSNPERPDTLTSMPVGPLVMDRLLFFIGQLAAFSKVLVERRMQIAQFSGRVPPVLLASRPIPGGTRLDAFALGGTQFERLVDQRGRAILAGMERTDIRINVKADIDEKGFENDVAFFRGDWRLRTPPH